MKTEKPYELSLTSKEYHSLNTLKKVLHSSSAVLDQLNKSILLNQKGANINLSNKLNTLLVNYDENVNKCFLKQYLLCEDGSSHDLFKDLKILNISFDFKKMKLSKHINYK